MEITYSIEDHQCVDEQNLWKAELGEPSILPRTCVEQMVVIYKDHQQLKYRYLERRVLRGRG